MKRLDGHKLVFLDESGCQSNMARAHSWSKIGKPTISFASPYRKKNVTVMGAIRSSGPVVMKTQDRPMKKKDFERFIMTDLGPRLSPGDVLVMDNLPSHRSAVARDALLERGVKILFTPPYMPEFNPIELVWSVMKSRIRKAKRTKQKTSFRYVIAGAWRSLRFLPLKALVRSCGYRLK